jgi:DNA-binding response OmpR family regulator
MEARILIIEDDRRIAELIRRYIEAAGFKALTAFDGNTGLNLARSERPDVILLDLMLPGRSGNDVCRILRRESSVPIIMLTARGAREDKIQGLDGGADDYMVKPFDPDELIVRIRALLRRSRSQVRRRLDCGPLTLDEDRETVSLRGEDLSLSHAQFLVLSTLIRQPGMVFSRNQIIDQAFGGDYNAYDRAIDTHIRRLRKIIHRDGFEPIETVYGAGYRMRCQ